MATGGLTGREKTIKELFIGKCWSYLDSNFSKFTEANRIKIALALCQKDMPTIMEGGLNVTQMPTVKKDGKEMELQIGDTGNPGDVEHPGEVAPLLDGNQ